ncbi:hypothetical protein B0I53_000713 [Clostridium saccharobutylicum]|nr:hypothetical protein [Clostridium saccharobutylicum]
MKIWNSCVEEMLMGRFLMKHCSKGFTLVLMQNI